METTRVAIIGAGPIGLELAAALKLEGIGYLQFDASSIGATIAWYPQQMLFHSNAERLAIAGVAIQTAGQQKPTREEYLAYLRAVVLQYGLQIRSYERVLSVTPIAEGGFEVVTSRSSIHAEFVDRKSTRLNSSHVSESRMPSSA